MVLWDTCFVLALPFHHRDLEPDCRCRSFDEGGAYARDKNTSARLCANNAGVGGLMREGGRAYLRDTTVSFHHTKFGSHPLSLYRIYGKQKARGCRLAFQA